MDRRLITAAVVLAVLSPLSAQAQRVMKPGDRFPVDAKTTAEILSCRDPGPTEKCMVQYYQGGAKAGVVVEVWSVDLRKGEQAARAAGGPAVAAAGPAPAGSAPVACPVPPAGPVTAAAPAGAATFKRKIYDLYAMSVTGTLSAPKRVGVTFEAFTVGAATTNKVSVLPGVGATRVTNGAPPNAALYPVQSRHVVCEQWGDGSTARRRVQSSYFCFKSAEGQWSCGGTGVPTITQLGQ